MHDEAATHETLVSALSASPAGPDVVCVVQLAPYAGVDSATAEATSAARSLITLDTEALAICHITQEMK
jgi:hypothetical protein